MWIRKILLRKEILLKSPSIQLKSPSSQLKSPSAKALSEVKDPTTKGSTNNCIASAAQDIADFICIVDNITTNGSKPRNSVTIKREIKKISSEKINMKHTSSFPRGGGVFHFKAQEYVNEFAKEVDNIYQGITHTISKSLS